jgi:hypothetical protein
MHWTYETLLNPADPLRQGDILVPTPSLRGVLDQVHRHFCDPKYLGFMVVSQSCDLVPRTGGECKAPHIEIAVIRPLADVLFSLLDQVCDPLCAGVYPDERRRDCRQFLERTFNQNEAATGLFYLHPDLDACGIAEHAVAVLRVSIALRRDHYPTLVEARRGRLLPEFSNKLGWLVGNLYSRVGTPDWNEQDDGKKQLRALVDEFVSASDVGTPRPIWLTQAQLAAAGRAGLDFTKLPREGITAAIGRVPIESNLELAIKETLAEVSDVCPDVTPEQLKLLGRRLRNSQTYPKRLK